MIIMIEYFISDMQRRIENFKIGMGDRLHKAIILVLSNLREKMMTLSSEV